MLHRAALTPVTEDDPLARTKAVARATRRVKQAYPGYFRKDDAEPIEVPTFLNME
jgi:hypothetical protein